MEVIDYFKSDKPDYWFSEIKKSDWRAAETLASFIEEKTFYNNLGEGTLLLLADGDRIVSFVTFTEKDCIDDKKLTPWIGFAYTFPEYRGRRCVGKLIRRCEKIAAEKGFPKIYVCTDNVGLYEKYGFSYIENRVDIYGKDSRVYFKTVSKGE